MLISRVHRNVCARIGVDASYVTDGVCNRLRLEKGANGDLWGIFFGILDMRVAEIDFHKVASHIEGYGLQAVSGGFAELVDIIGNALADEAAELAVKLLRPEKELNSRANEMDELAFAVCIRIGMVQSRLWDLFGASPIYEAPDKKDHTPVTGEKALSTLISEMKLSGHRVESRFRGNLAGLWCTRCLRFRNNSDFHLWKKTCVPKAKPEELAVAQARRRSEISQRANAERVRKETSNMHEAAISEPAAKVPKLMGRSKPTAEDDEDTEWANSDRPMPPSKRPKFAGEGQKSEREKTKTGSRRDRSDTYQ